MRPQRQEKYPLVRDEVAANMSKLVLGVYLTGGVILDLTSFFF